MRRLLVGLLILAGVVLLADPALRAYAESRAEGELEREFDLRSSPSITIHGWPFLIHAVQGSFPSVEVEIGSLKQGIRFAKVSMELEDVRVSFGRLFAGKPGAIQARGGTGGASLSDAGLNAALEEEGIDGRVAFEGSTVLLSAPQLPDEVSVQLLVRENTLVVEDESGVERLAIDLPPLTKGVTYEKVDVVDSQAVFTIRFERTSL